MTLTQSDIAIGATVAILDQGRVLMCKREDFEVWCLPGGQADPGESLAETAVREAKEEVGLDIALEGFVGVYSVVGLKPTIHLSLFVARATSGELKAQVDEVIDIAWMDAGALPQEMFWWHRQPIADAVAGARGVAYTAIVQPAQDVANRRALYALRDESGMARTAFYHHYFEQGPRQVIRTA